MAKPVSLTKADIRRLFELLNTELAEGGVEGEVYVVGGAVMCLALGARDATRDVDAVFKPAKLIREAAARVAVRAAVPANWLNDAVKGFLSPRGGVDPPTSNCRTCVSSSSVLLRAGDEMRGDAVGRGISRPR